MTSSRERMLARIRTAMNQGEGWHVQRPHDIPAYAQSDTDDIHERCHQFAERVREYKAWVGLTDAQGIAAMVQERCALRAAQQMVAPRDIPAAWIPETITVQRDLQLTAADISASDGVITGAAFAIAPTGTIILDAGAYQGRRMLTLLPDYHICVVYQQQIVGGVPEAFRQLRMTDMGKRQPLLTCISGPSATSDIELNRVEGVHGPRTLDVILVTESM